MKTLVRLSVVCLGVWLSFGRIDSSASEIATACPCSLFDNSAAAGSATFVTDTAVDVGVKFSSSVAGYITGLRFFKPAASTGEHTGRLWAADGTLLGVAVFTNETASGWQEVTFNTPVAIAPDTVYVASYHTSSGYVVTGNFFSGSGLDNGPLHAPVSSTTPGQGNGVYRYGPGGFPDTTFGGANYWVDVVFNTVATPDTTRPTVLTTSPVNNAVNIPVASSLTAAFSEPMNPGSITSATFHLHKGTPSHDAMSEVPVIVTYDGVRIVATLDPSANMDYSQNYTAVVVGGASGVKDIAGNTMAADFSWSFTTAAAPTPTPPPAGPGGPILVVSATASPLGIYYAEILKTEGLNAFATVDISELNAAMLTSYDTVVLAEMPPGMLTAAHVSALTNWVGGGGHLIAMRPDAQLESLLGITRAGGTIKDAYFKIRTNAAPGQGLVSDTIQFHGTADRYTLGGAAEIATLFATEATTLGQPAVTMRNVGVLGGHAIAFTFDLARSVVGLRQGNPAWSGQERDGMPPIRSDDLFFGASPLDPQPDWVDLNKVGIPQADEQQRLLANIIHYVMVGRRPMPRFWYLPFGHKAAVMMTGDDHNHGGTAGRFNIYESASPAGCAVGDWTCIRSTSYIYTPSGLTKASAATSAAKGFEVALHAQTDCLDWTPDSLRAFYTNQLAAFNSFFGGPGGLPAPRTHRMHCLAWSDYETQPIVELENGIRLDTSFYYWPPSWIKNRPGYFTGSALPMRYVRLDGSTVDVYQAVTHMTDESEQTFPMTVNVLLDNALGPNGYYGVLTANMHTDSNDAGNEGFEGSAAIIASAKARGVPVVSAVQVLDWLDARNGSAFQNITWTGNRLTFAVSAPVAARGLRAMIPAVTSAGRLFNVTRNGAAIEFRPEVIKGVEYAFVDAMPGAYDAAYAVDTTPPTLVSTDPVNGAVGVDLFANVTVRFSEAVAPQTVNGATVTLRDATNGIVPATLTVNGAAVTLDPIAGLLPNAVYTISIGGGIADLSGNLMGGGDRTSRFTTKGIIIADDTGGTATGTEILHGELVLRPDPNPSPLAPGMSADFPGPALPAGWSSKQWSAGGSAAPVAGELVLNGAQAGFDRVIDSGDPLQPGTRRSLEFEAKFTDDFFQHAGLSLDYDNAAGPWIDFSTSRFGNRLFARVNNDLVDLGSQWLNVWARFRIEWTASSAAFFINGAPVAVWPDSFPQPTGTFPALALRPLASDLNVGASDLRIRWLRAGPYVGSGSFISPVFDAGSQVMWGAISWESDIPAGIGVLIVEERHGNTATPPASEAAGGGWSAFAVVPQPGASIDAEARYAQYRATLITADRSYTPALRDVTIAFKSIVPVPPAITWATPADITAGTPLSAAQLNATAAVAGTFGYNPAAGTVLNAGTGQTLSVTFMPADTVHYVAVTKSVTINVIASVRPTTTSTPASSASTITYGTAVTFTATASASGGTPAGTMSFFDNGALLGTASLNASGTASLSTTMVAVGPRSITARYNGSAQFSPSTSAALTETVNKATASATMTVSAMAVQYSDLETYEVTVTGANGEAPAQGANFKIGTQVMNGATPVPFVNHGGGVWKARLANNPTLETVAGQLNPNGMTKIVSVTYTGASPNYTLAVPTAKSILVNKEDARASYAGPATVQTTASGGSAAVIPLKASIKDIAVTAEAAGDGTVGDVRLARVAFVNRATGATIASNVAVTIDPDDPTGRNGIATFNWNVDIGASTTQTFTIGFVVSNYYSRNSTAENGAVVVNRKP